MIPGQPLILCQFGVDVAQHTMQAASPFGHTSKLAEAGQIGAYPEQNGVGPGKPEQRL